MLSVDRKCSKQHIPCYHLIRTLQNSPPLVTTLQCIQVQGKGLNVLSALYSTVLTPNTHIAHSISLSGKQTCAQHDDAGHIAGYSLGQQSNTNITSNTDYLKGCKATCMPSS